MIEKHYIINEISVADDTAVEWLRTTTGLTDWAKTWLAYRSIKRNDDK
jgi:hypothetical protein